MSAEQLIDVRDMAIVHQMFRRTFEESAQLVRANPTPSAGRVTFLSDHISFALHMLHHHHENEDETLYPRLLERAPDEAANTERVEHEHREVEGLIDAATANCEAWRSRPSVETGEALAASLVALNDGLQPHLDHEEQTVVPLAARVLTQAEWDAMGESAVAAIPKKFRGVSMGMMVEPLNKDDADYMKRNLPGPVRLLYPLMVERPWRKYASQLRDGV